MRSMRLGRAAEAGDEGQGDWFVLTVIGPVGRCYYSREHLGVAKHPSS